MVNYIFDFAFVSIVIIILTATLAHIMSGIVTILFSRKRHTNIFNQSKKIQKGWNHIGGKGK